MTEEQLNSLTDTRWFIEFFEVLIEKQLKQSSANSIILFGEPNSTPNLEDISGTLPNQHYIFANQRYVFDVGKSLSPLHWVRKQAESNQLNQRYIRRLSNSSLYSSFADIVERKMLTGKYTPERESQSVQAEVVTTVDESIARIEQSRATIASDLEEIERLKADTRAMLTKLLAA